MFKDCGLSSDRDDMKSLFDPVIDKVISLIEDQARVIIKDSNTIDVSLCNMSLRSLMSLWLTVSVVENHSGRRFR
jgi:hypothetical protein